MDTHLNRSTPRFLSRASPCRRSLTACGGYSPGRAGMDRRDRYWHPVPVAAARQPTSNIEGTWQRTHQTSR